MEDDDDEEEQNDDTKSLNKRRGNGRNDVEKDEKGRSL